MLVLTRVDGEQIAEHRDRDEFFWLDLTGPGEAQLDRLQQSLDLHPMALEDTRELGQRPKADVYRDYVLVVFYTVQEGTALERVVHPVEVHVYISGGWMVTVHEQRLPLLERLHDELGPAGTHEEEYLIYRIFDGLTDAFFPGIQALEEQIDALEADVLARPRRELLSRVYHLKQEVHELQRLIAGQRDQFQTASGAILELSGLSHGTREYLRDVVDHLTQVGGELQRQSDDLTSLTSIYFSASAERVNRTATRLSVAATFFVAWTLVTGFFGQNFGWLVDSIDTQRDFLLYGVGGIVVPTLLLAVVLWVKRHDWF